MQSRFIRACVIAFLFLIVACSSEQEHLLTGKWNLAGRMIGGTPSSFWFKWSGTVIAPWEKHNFALISEGSYELVNGKYIKIIMHSGHYKGNMYNFEIIEMDEQFMTLGSEYETFRLKKVQVKEE